jgi:hypothetical protein
MTVRFDAPAEAPKAEAWSPYTPTVAAALPKLPPGNPFVFAHYPTRWYVDAESGEILPDLVSISLQTGVNGTGKEVPGGGGDPIGALNSAQRRGATLLVEERQRTIEQSIGGPLYRRVQTTGGYVWLDHATEAIPGTNQLRADDARRLTMLRAIRDVLAPPAPHVLEAMLERIERDHAEASKDADRNPLAARQADRLAAEADIVRAALAPPEPAPTTRSRRKAATDKD